MRNVTKSWKVNFSLFWSGFNYSVLYRQRFYGMKSRYFVMAWTKYLKWNSNFTSKIKRRCNTPPTLSWMIELEICLFSWGRKWGAINWVVLIDPMKSGTSDCIHCSSYIWFISYFLLKNCMTIVFDFLRKYHWLFVTEEKNVL